MLKELNHHVEAIKAENDKILDRKERLKGEKISLERTKIDLTSEIDEEIKAKKAEYQPRIDEKLALRSIR